MALLPAIILKTVLIIFLVLVILILALLFIPVRYRFSFTCGNEKIRESLTADLITKETDALIRISWLLRIFSLTVAKKAGSGLLIRARFLFISIPVKRRKKAGGRKKKASSPARKKKKDSRSMKTRLSQFADACGKMDDVRFGRLLNATVRRAGRFAGHILPQEAFLDGIIGTGDPAGTGRVFMLLGILEGAGIRRISTSVDPDMENARCMLRGNGKGRLFLFRAVQIILWAVSNKDIRALRKALRNPDQQSDNKKEEADNQSA